MRFNDWKFYVLFLWLTIGVFTMNAGIKEERLPEAVLKDGNATVNICIEGYDAQDSLSLSIGGFIPFGAQEYLVLNVPIDENGTAQAKVKMNIPKIGSVKIGNNHFMVLLAPDEIIDIILSKEDNLLQFKAFEGFLSQTHTDLRNLEFNDDSYGIVFMQQLQNCKDSTERIGLLRKQLDETIARINLMDITEGAKAFLRMGAELEYLYWLNNFGVSFIGRQAYLKLIDLPSPEEYGKTIAMADSLLPAPPEGSIGTEKYVEALGAPYAPIMSDFGDYYAPDKVYIDKDGNPNYYNRDLFLAQEIIQGKNHYAGVVLIDNIKDRKCKEFVDTVLAQQRKHAQELSRKENIYCHTLDDVAPDKILDVILDRYKGKNVFIDIWETWCQPCLKGHKEMEHYKKELEDMEIEFVYLTSPSSPLSLWEKMIPEISGHHYYLTSEQINAILRSFGSTGYPTYAIYDKEGKLKQKSIGYPGLNKMKSMIEESTK